MRTHPIKQVINRLLELDVLWEDGREVPVAREEEDCVVCHCSSRLPCRVCLKVDNIDMFRVDRIASNGSSATTKIQWIMREVGARVYIVLIGCSSTTPR